MQFGLKLMSTGNLLCLVSQSQQMLDLKMNVEELHMENEYQLRLKDMSYNEKIRELTASFNQQIHSLKTILQVCAPPSQPASQSAVLLTF